MTKTRIKQKNSNTKFYDLICLFICFIFTIFASLPLFHAGFFSTIDNISVVRVDEMSKELLGGQFPVRHMANLAHGHGYMLFNFYAPLPFYTASLLHLIGTNLVGSVKRTFFLGLIFSMISMFIFSREFFGRKAAIVSTVLFVFSPFMGYDIYSRGGLGEAWALSILPLAFWSFYKVVTKPKKLYVLIAAITLACIIISHNLTAYICIPFLFIWMLSFFRKESILTVSLSFILALGIASFFWIPVFTEKSLVWVTYTQNSFDIFQKEFLSNIKDVLHPYPPAKFNLIFVLIPVIAMILSLRIKTAQRKIILISSLMFTISFLLITRFSYIFWKAFYGELYIIQFPWRLLVISTTFYALLGGAILVFIKQKYIKIVIATIIILIPLLFSYKNFRPAAYEFIPYYKAEDPCGTSWGYEYLPVWVKSCFLQTSNSPSEISSGIGESKNVIHKPDYYFSTVNSSMGVTLRFNEYYYPGWEVNIDNKSTRIFYDNQFGMMEVLVPPGKHRIEAILKDTLLRKISNYISIFSIGISIILLTSLIYKRFINTQKHQKR